MARTIATGEQDFSKIIEYNSFYVDKTDFIQEWWENADTVTLIARPRRFGKTLTMSMLDYFFSIRHAGRNDLFENLNIWKKEEYRRIQGTYPVIFLSFANVKADHYEEAYTDICKLIAREYRRYAFILESDVFFEADKEQFFKYINGKADASDINASLNQLSEYLYDYYGKKVIILLDEYDTPMQEAFVNGYWKELTAFIRKLFHAAFKTNLFLERAVMTGITRVSKESVFSDLNNLAVVTTATELYETAFGFTEEEVFRALEEFGLQHEKAEVKRWYDGFKFGNHDNIYNPWSVTQFLKFKKYKSYWANTSSNALVAKLIQESNKETKMIVEDLLQGKSFRTMIDEQIDFGQLERNENAVWSLLLAGGYLKIIGFEIADPDFKDECVNYELALTNLELVLTFRKMVSAWFDSCSCSYNDFMKALLVNDIENMNVYMNEVALAVISFFDSGNKISEKTEPERFYHGFVLGLLVNFSNRYIMTSNRESGKGRYDVLLEPLNNTDDGIIFEFKVFQPLKEKSLEDTAQAAIAQILAKKYAVSLEKKCSWDRIRIYGFAFRGKEALIRGGYIREYENI